MEKFTEELSVFLSLAEENTQSVKKLFLKKELPLKEIFRLNIDHYNMFFLLNRVAIEIEMYTGFEAYSSTSIQLEKQKNIRLSLRYLEGAFSSIEKINSKLSNQKIFLQSQENNN